LAEALTTKFEIVHYFSKNKKGNPKTKKSKPHLRPCSASACCTLQSVGFSACTLGNILVTFYFHDHFLECAPHCALCLLHHVVNFHLTPQHHCYSEKSLMKTKEMSSALLAGVL
jgi:hypothetical protein